MFLVNLSKREKILFYITITAILLSLIYNFVFKALDAEWRQLNSQILDKEIRLKRNARYLQQKDNVKGVYLEYVGYVKKKGSDEEEIASFLNEVETTARSSGIHIANIRPKPIKDLVFCKKYILEMDSEATMEKHIEFIYNLQKSSQLIRVEKIKLTSQGRDISLLKARMLITKILATTTSPVRVKSR